MSLLVYHAIDVSILGAERWNALTIKTEYGNRVCHMSIVLMIVLTALSLGAIALAVAFIDPV